MTRENILRAMHRPAPGPVAWLVRGPDGRSAVVRVQTWFAACEAGARLFACTADAVEAELVSEVLP